MRKQTRVFASLGHQCVFPGFWKRWKDYADRLSFQTTGERPSLFRTRSMPRSLSLSCSVCQGIGCPSCLSDYESTSVTVIDLYSLSILLSSGLRSCALFISFQFLIQILSLCHFSNLSWFLFFFPSLSLNNNNNKAYVPFP